MSVQSPQAVLDYWFGPQPAADAPALGQKMKRWYQGGPAIDAEIIAQFGDTTEAAVKGELSAWEAGPESRLALILVLDQFTRSVFRNQARMYAGDATAQRLAWLGDTFEDFERRLFTLMPLAHAEDVAAQQRNVAGQAKLVSEVPAPLRPVFGMGIEQSQKYLGVITRFGRFPHRNEILGRTSTAEELEFLRDWAGKQPPSDATKLLPKS
jgi:uncharacterized protein (DUF924 family)